MLLPVLTAYEKEHLSERQPLPERYLGLSDEEMDRRIAVARKTLGRRLVILGHHYQRDEVIKFADYTGDSYKLAGQVSKHPDAEFIVFCGVHFMAESADVLSAPHQQVILPDLAAGCSMADMAEPDQLEMCWADLEQMLGSAAGIVPVTYINSSAAIKAFVGERGGVVCTSSNAAATLKWAWERGRTILFLPDQHLGRNTAYKLGVPLDRMPVWDPNEIWGGLEPDVVRDARMLLWKGHCSVHARFTVRQIENIRAQHPGVHVIVHPEVPWDVAQAADDSGSTEYIIKTVRIDVGGRHRGPSREPARARGRARAHGALARPVRLPVLDDVPRLAQPSAVGARRPGRRRGAQPHRRARCAEALDEGRPRPDALDLVATPTHASWTLRRSQRPSHRSAETFALRPG
jgi:quinolinate synthase